MFALVIRYAGIAMVPISTIFMGYIFLNEPITALQLTGAALVLAGVLVISFKKT